MTKIRLSVHSNSAHFLIKNVKFRSKIIKKATKNAYFTHKTRYTPLSPSISAQ